MTETTLSPSPEATARTAITAFAIDVVMVTAFVIIGRSSHDRDLLRNLGNTLWPFLLALVVAWLVSKAWRWPLAPLRAGLPIWIGTAAVGMLLRWAAGQGVQTIFIFVGIGFLFLFLVGWRLLVAAFTRVRPR